jgi:hydrogenase expression/formation protein HypD
MNRRIDPSEALKRLASAAKSVKRKLTFMEVCGTHTVSAFRTGLHTLLPENVRLLSGPGCPVCVTAQGDIDRMIALSSIENIILCTYGDMLRVTGSGGSLMDARAKGSDVRIVYSALDAVDLAVENPNRQVVFAAVGFETTAPATAVAVAEAANRGVDNFAILTSHKLVMPAMHALLGSGDLHVDGFVLPGHVAVIVGAQVFEPIISQYHKPCVIAGFEGEQIAAALALLTEMCAAGKVELHNMYPQAVSADGNGTALGLLNEIFEPVSQRWRGLAELPASGLGLREKYSKFDAISRFSLPQIEDVEPKGCRCGDVITGRCSPADCKLFAVACTPVRPLGPCMVSSEGTCSAWFKYGRNKQTKRQGRPQGTRQSVGGVA